MYAIRKVKEKELVDRILKAYEDGRTHPKPNL